ncbi:MAG: DNA polymerase IV [Syntrophobacter sp.]
MTRRIMHLDMDAFYASVEQADNPELRGKPVLVGGAERGVVCAASYEARKFGVHSAMPVFQAKKLCPQGIFLPVRMSRYKEVSRAVMNILAGISPLVERVSIDEAFVDISGTEALYGPPRALSLRVKSDVLVATALTCSVGVAPNKFLAKIASDLKKPDGLTIIEEQEVESFLKVLPARKIPGVGQRTAEELKNLGIVNAADILKLPLRFWVKRFGKWGVRLHEKARGIDDTPIETVSDPKSISAEETFAQDIEDMAELEKMLLSQAEEVGRDLRSHGLQGRTVVLKLKYSDFKTVTRSRTLPSPFDSTQVLFTTARQLLKELNPARKVRLIGVGVSNFSAGFRQMQIVPGKESESRGFEHLDQALDRIQKRFGDKAIIRGRLFEPRD